MDVTNEYFNNFSLLRKVVYNLRTTDKVFDKTRNKLVESDEVEEYVKLLYFTGNGYDYKQLYNIIHENMIGIENIKRIKNNKYWADLYEYQIDAIKELKKWKKPTELKEGSIVGGLLGFKMGLGKTVTTLSYIESEYKKNVLIICDKSNIQTWTDQIEQYYSGMFNYVVLHKDYIKKPKEYNGNHCLIITTYEFVASCLDNKVRIFYGRKKRSRTILGPFTKDEINKKDMIIDGIAKNITLESSEDNPIYSKKWDIVVCDEASKLVNPKTKVSRAVSGIFSDYYLVLSGTPIINYSDDLYGIFRFLGLKLNYQNWTTEYYFQKDLQSRVYGLTYREANVKLPPLEIREIKINMNEKQENLYRMLVTLLSDIYTLYDDRVQQRRMSTLMLFAYVRMVAISPKIIDFEKFPLELNYLESKIFSEAINFKGLYPKTQYVVDIIKSNRGKGILIFSSYKKALKNIFNVIRDDFNSALLTGETSTRDRIAHVKDMNEGNLDVLLLGYKVGSMGLNITGASIVILLEPWFNETTEEQAIARSHRIGQKNPVTVYKLISNRTFEEYIIDIQKRKKHDRERVLGGDIDEEKIEKTIIEHLIFGEYS